MLGQDPVLASQAGIHVRRIYLGTWMIAGALAAWAGISYSTTNVAGSSLIDLGLLAFPALILGGLDSVEGAIAGGLAIGMVESFVSAYWSANNVDLVSYLILLVTLLFLPYGFYGTRQNTRV